MNVYLKVVIDADQPAARRHLALHLLELLGAPLGAWRCSNAAAGDADAADALGPQLAAALAAVGGDPASPGPDPDLARNPGSHAGGAARAPQGCAAWLSPDGYYACSAPDALAVDAGSAAAEASGAPLAAAVSSAATPRPQPLHPAPAWFQARPGFTPCYCACQNNALELLLDALVCARCQRRDFSLHHLKG